MNTRTLSRGAAAAALTVAALALTACGSSDSRDAAMITTSMTGSIVTDTSTDLGSIVIGWGEQHTDTEITTPKPEDVTARCTGNGENLGVEITAPHGWKVGAQYGSQTLTISNSDQELAAAELDTTNPLLAELQAVDWSEADQVDIAATVAAPAEWESQYSSPNVYLSVHVDCR